MLKAMAPAFEGGWSLFRFVDLHPGLAAGLSLRSLQRGADRAKVAAQLGADTLHGGNDGNGDTGGNQAVFDRGGTGFIVEKRQNERLHGGSYPLLLPLGGVQFTRAEYSLQNLSSIQRAPAVFMQIETLIFTKWRIFAVHAFDAYRTR
jgi:hypothetical protein